MRIFVSSSEIWVSEIIFCAHDVIRGIIINIFLFCCFSDRPSSSMSSPSSSTRKQTFSEFMNLESSPSTSGNSGKTGMVVKTFLPQEGTSSTRKKVFDIASSLVKQNLSFRETAVFSKTLAPCSATIWPVAPLTQSGDKFGGMMIPPFLSPDDPCEFVENVRYVFFRPTAMNAVVELNRSQFLKFVEVAEQFLTFLRTMEGRVVVVGEMLPQAPEPVVLRETSEERIVFQIDPPFKQKKEQQSYCPTVSLRVQNRKKTGSWTGIGGGGNIDAWKDAIFPQLLMGGSSLWFFIHGKLSYFSIKI